MAQVSEDAIREQAYYLWEQDGRPMGRDIEYWQRAMMLQTPQGKRDVRTAAAPATAKSKAKTPEPKAAAKVKAAATQSKAAPAKSVKAAAKKPKKK